MYNYMMQNALKSPFIVSCFVQAKSHLYKAAVC